MSKLVAITERSSNLFRAKLRLIAPPKAEQKTERSGGQKGRGLGGRPRRSRFATLRGKNFCPPSLEACLPLADSDFSAAAEFRISQSKMRRQEKRCCVYPALPCAHNKFTPFIIITYFGLYHNRIYNISRYVKINLLKRI